MSELGPRGAAFKESIEELFDLGDGEKELLLEAARTLDLVDTLQSVVDEVGPLAVGSRGQPVVHPAVGQLMAARALLLKLVAAMGFPGEEKVWTDAARRAQHAANSRWSHDADVRELRKQK